MWNIVGTPRFLDMSWCRCSGRSNEAETLSPIHLNFSTTFGTLLRCLDMGGRMGSCGLGEVTVELTFLIQFQLNAVCRFLGESQQDLGWAPQGWNVSAGIYLIYLIYVSCVLMAVIHCHKNTRYIHLFLVKQHKQEGQSISFYLSFIRINHLAMLHPPLTHLTQTRTGINLETWRPPLEGEVQGHNPLL